MIADKENKDFMRQTAKSIRLSKCLEEFVRYQKFSNHSKHTIKYYTLVVLRFVESCQKLNVFEIRKEDIISWVLEMRESGVRNSYISTCLWAVRSFNKFLRDELKLKIKDWFYNIKIEKRERGQHKEVLKNNEIDKFLEVIEPISKINVLRFKVLIVTILHTGCRPSEALSLNREQVIRDEIEIIGKGNKKRKIYLDGEALYWINKYLNKRNDNCSALFINHKGEPRRYKLRRAEEEFQKYFKMTGIQKRITLHSLRHTFATNLIRNGCPPDYIMVLLGHSKIETTRDYYLSIAQEDAKNARFKYLNYKK